MGANYVDPEGKIIGLERTIQRRDEEIQKLQEAINRQKQTIKDLEADLRYATLGIKAIKAILED